MNRAGKVVRLLSSVRQVSAIYCVRRHAFEPIWPDNS